MPETTSDRPTLVEIVVADPAEAWAAAGFQVGTSGAVQLGLTSVRPVGRDGERSGIVAWTVAGVDVADGRLDGLPTGVAHGRSTDSGEPPADHPNGATGIDHVVVSTSDLERTITAFETAGLPCRRIRDAGTTERPMRQAFFRLGPAIVEVVGGVNGSGTSADTDHARWFGLAVDVADLDHAAALLGPNLGRTKRAVQAGRRIATLRHQDLGLSVAVALMDDHGDR